MPRGERVRELFRRLADAPAPVSAEEAFELICRLVAEVEDDMSGIPATDPPLPKEIDDGRMYPPQGDNVRRTADGRIVAMTRGHRIVIFSDGRIEIQNRLTRDVEFRK